MKPPMDSFAVLSISMGAFGLLSCGLVSIPAIVTGHMAWKRTGRTGERGRGLAVTGIVLGWFMVAFWVLAVIGMLLPEEA